MKLDILTALNDERAARRAAIVITNVENGKQRFVKAAEIARDPLRAALGEHLRTGKSGMAETAEGRVFLTVYVPAPQLVITGAVHISQALAPIGKLLGYDVTIVDPRTAFASPGRFPDVTVIAEWPDTALPRLNVDRYTPFVALTHDPRSTIQRSPTRCHAIVFISVCSARERPMRAGSSDSRGRGLAKPISRASTRRSDSISARCRRRRSRLRSWRRLPTSCTKQPKLKLPASVAQRAPPQRLHHEIRGSAAERGAWRHCRALDPSGRPGAQKGDADRPRRGCRFGSRRHQRSRRGAA